MMKAGYAGQILHVDLTTGKVGKTLLDEQLAKSYIGGFGINAKLAYDYLPPRVDPLSPLNVIILGAGVLAGTMVTGSARLVLTTKLPENNTIFGSNGGMGFACMMKYAGYDHLIISGQSEKPVYLYIDKDRVEICDASELWGKDTNQVTEILWQKHSRTSSVIAIGQAGENLVPVALALVDRVATLGSKGGGAVFGSKNLKAIVVRGNGSIGVSKPQKFMRLINDTIRKVRNDPRHQKWLNLSKLYAWPVVDWPYDNFERVIPSDIGQELFGPKVYLDKVKGGRIGCPSCLWAEKDVLKIKEGEFDGLTTYINSWIGGSENFGIRCGVDSYDKIVNCLDIVQRYGICRHAVITAIDYAVHLYDQGIITKEDTDGLELKRNYETTKILIDWIVFGHGIGKVLGKGIQGVATSFGTADKQDYSATKGTAICVDPRPYGIEVEGFEYIVNPKGFHVECWPPLYTQGQEGKFRQDCKLLGLPDEAISRIIDSPVGFNIGILTRYREDMTTVSNCLGLCQGFPYWWGFWSLPDYCELLATVTGIELTPEEMMAVGERAWNLIKVINVKEGFNRMQDTYPKKWLKPVEKQNGEKIYLRNGFDNRILAASDLDQMLDDYYAERGWEVSRGIPTREKLIDLGLANVAQDLEELKI
jgi:aldehyde:ferredoxin oxidoreductase